MDQDQLHNLTNILQRLHTLVIDEGVRFDGTLVVTVEPGLSVTVYCNGTTFTVDVQ